MSVTWYEKDLKPVQEHRLSVLGSFKIKDKKQLMEDAANIACVKPIVVSAASM